MVLVPDNSLLFTFRERKKSKSTCTINFNLWATRSRLIRAACYVDSSTNKARDIEDPSILDYLTLTTTLEHKGFLG